MDNLKTLVGRRAVWRVLLGILRSDDTVSIYEGITEGHIVESRGESAFGFDPVFQPKGTSKTLAEAKPDSVNARAKAINAFVRDDPASVHKPIRADEWKGKWQEH